MNKNLKLNERPILKWETQIKEYLLQQKKAWSLGILMSISQLAARTLQFDSTCQFFKCDNGQGNFIKLNSKN